MLKFSLFTTKQISIDNKEEKSQRIQLKLYIKLEYMIEMFKKHRNKHLQKWFRKPRYPKT